MGGTAPIEVSNLFSAINISVLTLSVLREIDPGYGSTDAQDSNAQVLKFPQLLFQQNKP
jgi:hypothetical protein